MGSFLRRSLQLNLLLQRRFTPFIYQNTKRFFCLSEQEKIEETLKGEFETCCEIGNISGIIDSMDKMQRRGVEVDFNNFTQTINALVKVQLLQEAEELLNVIVEYTRYIKWEWLHKICSAYMQNGEANKASALYSKYEKYPFRESNNEQTTATLKNFVDIGEYNSAIEYFNANITDKTATVEQLNLLLRAYIEHEDIGNANAVYDKIVKTHQPNVQTNCLYAILLAETGKFKEAVSFVENIGDNKTIVKTLIYRVLKNDKNDEALILYDKFGVDKVGFNSYPKLISALSIAGRGGEALDLLKERPSMQGINNYCEHNDKALDSDVMENYLKKPNLTDGEEDMPEDLEIIPFSLKKE